MRPAERHTEDIRQPEVGAPPAGLVVERTGERREQAAAAADERADGGALRVRQAGGVGEDQEFERSSLSGVRKASCTSSKGTRDSTSAWYMPSM